MSKVLICSTKGIEIKGVPDEIKILPKGLVHSLKGEFVVDNESFNEIYKRFKERNLDIVIDYEHQTLGNVQAPAGGWIKELTNTEDAIVAKVEWTEKAAEYLKNREYRYLSPVVKVRKDTNKAIVLHSVALTNTPAINGMFTIANSEDIEEDDDNFKGGTKKMDLKELIKLLGLEDSASEEQIIQAIGELVKASKDGKEGDNADEKKNVAEEALVANSTILSLLDLKDNAKTEDVAAKIVALKNGNDGYAGEFLALKQRIEEKDANDAVTVALKEGKISSGQKEWAITYALKDPEGFKKFMEKAPQVVPTGKITFTDAPKTYSEGEVDLKILKNMGYADEEIKKILKKEVN